MWSKIKNLTFGQVRAAIYERRWRLMIYLALLAALFLLERSGDRADDEGFQMTKTARSAYLRASTFGYRKPSAKFTALMLLDDDPSSHHDPARVAYNACPRRLYLAKLTNALAAQLPSVIVFDFVFEAICPAEDEVLAASIREAAQHIPVVMGQDSEPAKVIRSLQPSRVAPGIDDGDIVPKKPNIVIELPKVKYGLVMLIADNRHVPVRWTTANSAPGSDRLTQHHVQDGLALSAATAHQQSVLENPTLIQSMKDGKTPLTSFIAEFPQQNGLDLLCKDQDPARWEDCKPTQDLASIFKGHIAVIGFDKNASHMDMHASVLGLAPGVILQANYIESLLDGRFLTQAWWPIEAGISFLFFVVIEVIFEFVKKLRVALPLALGVAAICYLISYFTVVQYGYYLQLWVPTLLALLLKATTVLSHRAIEGPGINQA